MKKLLFFGVFMAVFSLLEAQVYRYCRVEVIEPKLTSLQVIAYVDTGQVAMSFKDRIVKTADGKDKLFNSDVEVLNLMSSKNWEVVSVVLRPNNNFSTVYLFRKPAINQ
jgi:hypothetical protein